MGEIAKESKIIPPESKILLVDDEIHIVKALERHLGKKDLLVSTYTDPLLAKDAVSSEEFALIISDNKMPKLTGIELLGFVKKVSPNTRRILLTGQTEVQEAIKALNENWIHRFISKPWDVDELLEDIESELAIYSDFKKDESLKFRLSHTVKKQAKILTSLVGERKHNKTEIMLLEELKTASWTRLPQFVRNFTFLVVESHERTIGLFAQVLNKYGVKKCLEAKDATQALEYVASYENIDVILCEFDSAEIGNPNGFFETMKNLMNKNRSTKFMVTSTKSDEETVNMTLSTGVDAFLVKPFPMESVFKNLERKIPKSENDEAKYDFEMLRGLYYLIGNEDMNKRYNIQQILLNSGIDNVLTVTNGQKALEVLKTGKIDIALYDLNMRDPHWAELEMAIKALELKIISPILIVTGVKPTKKDLADLDNHKYDAFIPGFIRKKDLLETMLTTLRIGHRSINYTLT